MTREQIAAWMEREFVQSSYSGGWPLPNVEARHGEPLLILPKAVVARLVLERERAVNAVMAALTANTAPFAEKQLREALAFVEEEA